MKQSDEYLVRNMISTELLRFRDHRNSSNSRNELQRSNNIVINVDEKDDGNSWTMNSLSKPRAS